MATQSPDSPNSAPPSPQSRILSRPPHSPAVAAPPTQKPQPPINPPQINPLITSPRPPNLRQFKTTPLTPIHLNTPNITYSLALGLMLGACYENVLGDARNVAKRSEL